MAKKKVDIEVNVNTKDATAGIDDLNESIGETTEGIADMAESSGLFGNSLKNAKAGFAGLKQGLSLATKGFGSLKAAIASTGIGLLLLALGSLVTFFTKTKRGAELLEVATASLGAIFGVITDKLSLLGEIIIDTFSNPKQTIIDLGNLIKENLINRIEAFSVIGKSIVKIFSGDFKEGFKELANGSIQLTTGVENAIDKVQELGEAAVDGFGELSTQISAAATAAAELQRRQIALRDAQREFRIEQAGFQDLLDKQKQIADDTTNTEQVRLEALDKAFQLEKRNAEQKVALAKEEFEIIKAQNALSESTEEDIERQAEAEIALREAQALSAKLNQELIVKQNNVKREFRDREIAATNEAQAIITGILEEGLDKELAIIEQEKQAKLSAIKFNSEEEQALREAIEKEAETKRLKAIEENEKLELEKKRNFLTELTKLRIEAIEDETVKAIEALNLQYESERIAILENEQLTQDQKNALLQQLETNHLNEIDRIQAEQDEKERQRRLKKAAEIIAGAQQVVGLASEVNNLLNVLGENRLKTETSRIDASIKNEEAKFNRGVISEDELTKFKAKAENQKLKIENEAAEKAFKRNKALQIAQAGLNTAAAVVSALASVQPTYPAGAIAAGIAAATGAVQIAAIAAKKFSPKTSGSISGGSLPKPKLPSAGALTSSVGASVSGGIASFSAPGAAPSAVQTTLTPTSGSEVETVGSGQAGVQQQPIRAYVSEREITTVQGNISNIEQRAEIGG